MSGVARIFNGKELFQPGSYAKRVYRGAIGGNGIAGNVFFILGASTRGIPHDAKDFDGTTLLPLAERINYFTRRNEVYPKLKSGELYETMDESFHPSSQEGYTPPPIIYAVDPTQKTRSTSTMVKTATTIIDLYSRVWGVDANKISKKLTAGTTTGKKLEFKFEDLTWAVDNLTKELFTIQYTGNATTAVMSISATQLTTTLAGDQTDGSVNLTIDFTQYTTIEELVGYINAQTGYTASLTGDAAFINSKLDVVTAQAIKASAYTVKAIVEAIITWINNTLFDTVFAQLHTGSTRQVPDNDTAFVYFTGGTYTAPTNSTWAATFSMMESVDCNLMTICSDDSTVISYFETHLEYMSGIEGRSEREGSCGAGLSLSKSDIQTKAKSINNDLITYIGTRAKRIDADGITRTKAGYQSAAKIFSMMAGNGVNFPVTMKELDWDGLYDSYTSTEKDDMIKARVTIIATNKNGGHEIVRALTTYQGDDAIRQSPVAMRISLFVTKDSRTQIQNFMKTLTTTFDASIITQLDSKLTSEILPSYVSAKYLTPDPDKGRAAFSDFQSDVVGDTYTYSFIGIIPLEFLFAFGTYNFTIIGSF